MADPTSLTDISEEVAAIRLPGPTAAADQASHNSGHYGGQRSRPESSAIDIGHFDPEGVEELRRRASTQQDDDVKRGIISRSDVTLADPFDFEKYLRDAVKKQGDAQHKTRELGVMFKDLRVVGLGASVSYQPTLGSEMSPLGIIDAIHDLRHPPVKDILSGFEGVVRPGEMLLVLGSPGSGCSTFLKTLANQRGEYYSVEGEVHYDSLSPEEVAKHYRGDVTYCPEDDVHFPTLTVEQTLRFAAKSRAPHQRLDNQSRGNFVTDTTEILSTIFGLNHAKKTLVGDAAIRGVSGGEKKRVSITEALAARSLIGAWDNSTRGLDASTALEFTRALRLATRISRLSTIVSIYQASESLYNCFDKVCVIYEGKMAYYGPADQARQYFINMGYQPANRQTTADFLVAVTNPFGRIEQLNVQSIPRTATDFVNYFQKSPLAQLNRDDIESYRREFVGQPQRANDYVESVKAEHAQHTRQKSPYITSLPMQVKALVIRRAQVLYGNKTAQILQLVSFMIQATILGTVFLRVPEATSAYFSRGGLLFFSILFPALMAMAEIPSMFIQRPIVARHEKAALYHPFVEAVAQTIVDIPMAFATSILFATILYEAVRLQQSASQFFIFFLYLFIMTLTMKAWFHGLSAGFESEANAQAIGGLSVLITVLYTGYVIPHPSMIGALRWITYINPIRYAFEGVMVNEFHTLHGPCSSLVPHGPGYENISLANQVCTTVGSKPGQSFVDGNAFLQVSFGYSYSHIWRNFGFLVAFTIVFLLMYFIFSEFNTSFSTRRAVTLFKRGSTAPIIKRANASADEEKTPGGSGNASETASVNEVQADAEKALSEAPPMTDIFSWHHMEYTVTLSNGEQRRLLDDVSGYVAPGRLTALMGESGAGKTTLLNVLAGRVTSGVVAGDRLVNGQALPVDFQAQTGYCQQMDTHVPTSTVREALLFSAKMRQPASVPVSEKEAYVETCLRMCGLEAYGDAVIGSLGIEHRKRTTIAVELAAKPRLLLFLDEPTSGLDSQSAWAIMSCLRSLADNGQAILCTIHQPSAELFQVFDRLLLLRKGGQTVYMGDIGHHSSTLIRYFENNGSRPCGSDENPAEFMLEVIGAGATAVSDRNWHDVWLQSKEVNGFVREVEAMRNPSRPAVETARRSEFAASWGYQLVELLKRNAQRHWRDPAYLTAKIGLNISSGLLIGFTFFKSKDTLQGTQNKLMSIFMSTILSVPLTNQFQIPFLDMRSVYEIRERPSRMYSWTAMITSLVLIEIPWNIFGASLFFLAWFWTMGFDTDRAGYTYLSFGVIFPLYFTTFGLAVAAMSPDAEIAAILYSFLFSFVVTFNGVLQPYSQLGWWKWMYRLSPFTYLIEGVMGQAVGHQNITCSPVELVTLEPPAGQSCGNYMQSYISRAGGYLTNPDATSDCLFCSYRTTDQYLLPTFFIEYAHRWRNIGIQVAFIMFNVACIYLLAYIFRIRTGSFLGSLKKRFTRNA